MSGKKSSILKYVKRKTKEYIYIYIYIYILFKTEIGSWHTECSTCTKQRA